MRICFSSRLRRRTSWDTRMCPKVCRGLLKQGTGTDVVIDVGFRRSSFPGELLQDFRKNFQVEWLGQMRIKTRSTGTRDIVGAPEAGDGDYGNFPAAVDLSQFL